MPPAGGGMGVWFDVAFGLFVHVRSVIFSAVYCIFNYLKSMDDDVMAALAAVLEALAQMEPSVRTSRALAG
jgi:hypothetical protein